MATPGEKDGRKKMGFMTLMSLDVGVESPFDVLSVDPDADPEEIKEAYRERIKDAHPDRGGDEAEFKRLTEAYETLTE